MLYRVVPYMKSPPNRELVALTKDTLSIFVKFTFLGTIVITEVVILLAYVDKT